MPQVQQLPIHLPTVAQLCYTLRQSNSGIAFASVRLNECICVLFFFCALCDSIRCLHFYSTIFILASTFNSDPAAHRIIDVLAPELCSALGWASPPSTTRNAVAPRNANETGVREEKEWSVAAAIAAGPQQTAPGTRHLQELLEVHDGMRQLK